jgi:hypothetical protein
VSGLAGDAGYADAVIDKDRAARLLATQLGAHALLLVTAVDQVMVDFGTPHQAPLGDITADEAARYLAEGQFPPGSMGPKVEAALEFLADGGEQVVITSPGLLAGTLTGSGARRGTRISPPARIIRSDLNGASSGRTDGTANGDGRRGGAGRGGDAAGRAGAGPGGHPCRAWGGGEGA